MSAPSDERSETIIADDIRPLVASDHGNRPLWIGIGVIIALGVALFIMLEGRRELASAPAIRPRVADLAVAPAALPPLYIPPAPDPAPLGLRPLAQSLSAQRGSQPLPPQFPQPRAVATFVSPTRVEPAFDPAQRLQPPAPPKQAVDASPAIVFDQTVSDEASLRASPSPGQSIAPAVAIRARAGRTRDRRMVVPQGTLIAAVLETALDSTQPGQARALVSRNVTNFDGGLTLIPRGSRLFGEYKGDLVAGQKRAMVQWTRLETPDGVTIAIDSPAADQLGRAGIKGKVNSQFAARLGGALLQSVIDVGAIAALRGVTNSPFFVGAPGAVQGSTSQLIEAPSKPTLTVKQGTRISVFVARDLDFSAVGAGK